MYLTTNGGSNWNSKSILSTPLYALASFDTVLTIAVGDGGWTFYCQGLAYTKWKGNSTTTNTLRGLSNPLSLDTSITSSGSSDDQHNQTFFAVGDQGCIETILNVHHHYGVLSVDGIWSYNDTTNVLYSIIQQPWTTQTLRAATVDRSNVYVVGDHGVFLKSHNSGGSWTSGVIEATISFRAVTMAGINRILAVGDSGRMCVTSDAGVSWTSVAPHGLSENLHAISFQDTSIGIVAGDNGMILKTTDGGRTWFRQASSSFANLRAVSCYQGDDGVNWLVAGDSGTVLQCQYGGSESAYSLDSRLHDFGSPAINSKPKQDFHVYNTAQLAYLTVHPVSLSSAFTVSSYLTLDPLSSGTVTVTFTPKDTSTQMGTIILNTNASCIPDTLIVRGVGTGAMTVRTIDTVRLNAIADNAVVMKIFNVGNSDLTATVKSVSDTNFDVQMKEGTQSPESLQVNIRMKHGLSQDLTGFFVLQMNDYRRPTTPDTFYIVAAGISGVETCRSTPVTGSCFPNPVPRNGTLTFQSTRGSRMKIFDINGCAMFETALNGATTINTRGFRSGVYRIEMFDTGMCVGAGMFVVQ